MATVLSEVFTEALARIEHITNTRKDIEEIARVATILRPTFPHAPDNKLVPTLEVRRDDDGLRAPAIRVLIRHEDMTTDELERSAGRVLLWCVRRLGPIKALATICRTQAEIRLQPGLEETGL